MKLYYPEIVAICLLVVDLFLLLRSVTSQPGIYRPVQRKKNRDIRKTNLRLGDLEFKLAQHAATPFLGMRTNIATAPGKKPHSRSSKGSWKGIKCRSKTLTPSNAHESCCRSSSCPWNLVTTLHLWRNMLMHPCRTSCSE